MGNAPPQCLQHGFGIDSMAFTQILPATKSLLQTGFAPKSCLQNGQATKLFKERWKGYAAMHPLFILQNGARTIPVSKQCVWDR